MTRTNCRIPIGRILGICFAFSCITVPASAQWSQWGGPNRNFMTEASGLAERWPEEGPKKLWHRELGDGYSTILVDGGVLYTMYRVGEDEFTVALDAQSGKTVWEHKNPSPFTEVMAQFGPGPHSTPVIAGDRLISIGSNGVMHCFDKKTGKVVWKHDLANEYDAFIPGRGYGASPIAYRNTIIVVVGHRQSDDDANNEDEDADGGDNDDANNEEDEVVEAQALIAFDRNDGHIVWKSQAYQVGYASPLLIEFDGQEQLVQLMAEEMIGVDPSNGRLLWHQPFEPQGFNIATPLWNGKDLLFCSSAYDSGSRVIKLSKKDGKTVPEQLWYTRKMRIHHGNAVRIGDHVYGSSGDFGPAFYTCMDIITGKAVWRKRGFKKATTVLADGNKVILLDEDGELALVTVSPEGMKVLSKCTIAKPYAWAAPTLVGTTLYVRDREHIMALDLS